jgi:hypothetical protein
MTVEDESTHNLHTFDILPECASLLLSWLDTDTGLACLAASLAGCGYSRGDTMAMAIVGVRSARGSVADVLIELFSVPADFQSQLPVGDRTQLATLKIERLGSAISDAHGGARIDYGGGAAERFCNLWLIASTVAEAGTPVIAYQERDVRVGAAQVEHFVVTIEDGGAARRSRDSGSADAAKDTVLAARADERRVAAALRETNRAAFAERRAVRQSFRTDVAPHLVREISTVVRDMDGKALDADYVEPTASVQEHAEARLMETLRTRFEAHAEAPFVLNGRLSLTDAQLAAIRQGRTVDATTNSVKIGLAELDVILRGDAAAASMGKLGNATMSRIEVVRDYCRPPSRAQSCLRDDPVEVDGGVDGADHGDEGSGSSHAGSGVGAGGPGDAAGDASAGDAGVSTADLKARLPGYMARLLDEHAALDAGFDLLKGPGAQLTEDDIRAQSTFPALVLPPGPADVRSLHEFHKLQIAFRPVWTEALDQSLLGHAEAAYDRYVELGGDPASLNGKLGWGKFVTILGTLLSPASTPPPAAVAGFVDVTPDEWSAMPAEYQYRLQAIALQAATLQTRVQVDGIGSHGFLDGLDDGDQRVFDSVVQYVAQRTAAYRAEAERLLNFARAELERRAATESPVPASRILSELKTRALSQYPARYFAANRQGCSVNFGLLVTYAQWWLPTVYQVGDLLTSIPLAPKETRNYSKKIVVKEKRARKEVESNLRSQKSETQSTSRAEAEIIQKALQKTNYNATASGTFQIGVYDVNGSNTLTADTQNDSAETKKSFHEAVVKAASEYRNEMKVELETENTYESEFQESGQIQNPNDELTVTYLFYELQRRYRVTERLHRLTSVVLVAQEMPQPSDIDEDWLIANRWILNRVLLDDVFRQPLAYVAESMVAKEHALTELKRALMAQRRLVDDLKGEVGESRMLTDSRYAALQRSMQRTARATQRGSDDGGLLGFAKQFTTLPAIESLAGRLFGSDNESPEAARVREAATRDAYERELERLRDLEGRLAQGSNALAVATKEYTNRLSLHLGNVVRVTELMNHVKDNALHYMQAIWLHESPDQRWIRLKDVRVPDLRASASSMTLHLDPMLGVLGNVAHMQTRSYAFGARCGTQPTGGRLPTVPLIEVADLDDLLGFKANYMIFALKKPNAITSFMMMPYVERAAGGFGITDPDDLGNMSLDEFGDYVCCLRKKLSPDEFASLKETLEAQLATLLQSPLRDDEEIVVPLDAMYIEALPGAHPILENFKLLHRQIDAADAQENLRLKKMEKLRYVQRLLADELEDPSVTGHYVFEGAPGPTVSPPMPAPGGGGPPP